VNHVITEISFLQDIHFGVRLVNLVSVLANPVPFTTAPYENLNLNLIKNTVLECEALRYHSIWMPDHLMLEKAELECWMTLAALSSIAEKIRLGTLVTCNSFRHPQLLAKMAATLDFISKGRLEFGIGAGWLESEYVAYGLPFPKANVRIAQLNEALDLIKKLWSEKKASYNGKYYHLNDAVCEPKPVQKPFPPITVGGSGKLTLKVVAQHADRCNIMGSLEECQQKLTILKKHCMSIGRSYEEIEISVYLNFFLYSEIDALNEKAAAVKTKYPWEKVLHLRREHRGHTPFICNPEECVEVIRRYVDLGATFFTVRFEDLPSKESARLFAEKVMSNI
jgi:alkanesulfonate monooxygenase SsuD/methylene tetrahydromethanopterin reductase-like flavin-dependent oxidoreductase (luciferase family)